MNSSNTNRQNVDYLTDRLGKVFENIDKRDATDLAVAALDVAAIRQGRALASLRRSMERDAAP